MTDTIQTLGKLIDGPQQRDAVHIAVAPAIAAHDLAPGQPVGFVNADTQELVGIVDKPIGVVDPFLKEVVNKGQWFWMFLTPGTITSLRHEWTHPAFAVPDDVAFSKKWLKEYAAKMNCYDDPEKAYETLVEGLCSQELFAHGTDLHGLFELEDSDELREHAEKVLGIRIDWDNYSFTCSC